MLFLFIFSLLILIGLGILAYYKYIRTEEEGEYIWVGKGENPLKHMK